MKSKDEIKAILKGTDSDSVKASKLEKLLTDYYWIGAVLGGLTVFFLMMTAYGLTR